MRLISSALAVLLASTLPATPLRAAQIVASVMSTDEAPLSEAVVYAQPASRSPMPPPKSSVMDQIGKEFVPFVLPIQVGTPVSFPNKDNIRHHVYSFSPPKPFELKLYSGTPSSPVVFDTPGVVTVGCNIHDWMIGHLVVVDTHWFAKTAGNGVATIEDLPKGQYAIQVWHPRMRSMPPAQIVTIDEAERRVLAIRIAVSPQAAGK